MVRNSEDTAARFVRWPMLGRKSRWQALFWATARQALGMATVIRSNLGGLGSANSQIQIARNPSASIGVHIAGTGRVDIDSS